MRDFRTLRVWQAAHAVTLSVYKASARFPDSERYGLTSQVRRAAASVAANLAEGCGLLPGPDRARLFQIAMGSACELEYHILLARDLGLLDPQSYDPLQVQVVQTKRMLAVLLRRIRQTSER